MCGATCHVSWWQGTRRPVRLISNHLNIHEQQLSGPRPLRCCTPAQPANISLTQHQAGGLDGEIRDGDDEDVTTPQNYYGVSCFSVLILTSPPSRACPRCRRSFPGSHQAHLCLTQDPVRERLLQLYTERWAAYRVFANQFLSLFACLVVSE